MERKVAVFGMDKRSIQFLQNVLTAQGYGVVLRPNGSEGFGFISDCRPDIVLTDPFFQGARTLGELRALREWSDCHIIAVSAAAGERFKVQALDAGADDYVVKPIPTAELLARLRAVIRRLKSAEQRDGMMGGELFRCGSLSVDFNSMSVKTNGLPVHLTKNEFKILSLLCRYPGRVLTYEEIIKSVWGPHITGDTGILRVNVANIRRKIGEGIIVTENSVGYRLSRPAVWEDLS